MPEADAALVAAGQPATLKFNHLPRPAPSTGAVARVGARVREEGRGALPDRRGRDREPRRPPEDRHARHRRRSGSARAASSRRSFCASPSASSGARSGPCSREAAPARPSRRWPPRGPRTAPPPSPARHGAAGRPPGAARGPRHPPRRPAGRGQVGGQEPGDHRSTTTSSDAEWGLISLFDGTRTLAEIQRRVPGAVPRRDRSTCPLVLEYRGDAPEDRPARADASPSGTSTLLAKARDARQRAAEEKAEGFNSSSSSSTSSTRTASSTARCKYVRWIWTPPVVAVCARLRRSGPSGVFVQPLGADLERDDGALRLPSEAPARRLQFFFLLSLHRLHPRVRPRLRRQDLRRRGARHRHRAALLHARVLLRHDRFAALREQVASPLGHDGRHLRRGLSSARSRRCVWVVSYPDTLLHEFAYKTMLFTGVSTVFFNINPLIKIDGYYALSRACSRSRSCAKSRSGTSARSSRRRSCVCRWRCRQPRAASAGSTGSTGRSPWPGWRRSCRSSAGSSTTSTPRTSRTGPSCCSS